MRSRTLANERTRPFYAKLKRPYLFSWYLTRLGSKAGHWHWLSADQKQSKFQIDQIAFFKKHFWYHFKKSAISGWIPVKHFRKNYCQLKLPINKYFSITNVELICILILCKYIKPDVDIDRIVNQYRQFHLKPINDLFMIMVSQVARFQNVSHKSMRRIRNQIRHQRPVVMQIKLADQKTYVIIKGFNRRLFQYILPQDGRSYLITRKRLLNAWRKCSYWAFSC